MSFRDQRDFKGIKKFKIDDIHCERGFLYILSDPGPQCACAHSLGEYVTKYTYVLTRIRVSKYQYICSKYSTRIRYFQFSPIVFVKSNDREIEKLRNQDIKIYYFKIQHTLRHFEKSQNKKCVFLHFEKFQVSEDVSKCFKENL